VQDRSDAAAEPANTARVLVERPPPGLARGKYPFPAWGIGVLGGALFLVGLAWFVVRLRRRVKR
jgi:hypothetical protein